MIGGGQMVGGRENTISMSFVHAHQSLSQGVTMSTMAQCWNEFKGTCKFQNAFWGDYCTCQ